MSFEALGEEVLLRIFCFCDIYTVLTLSAINKALRRIALAKQLWLSLVLDAMSRDALKLPPPNREKLEYLSTPELIAAVKNAVAGPGSLWDSAPDESSSLTMTTVRIPLDGMEHRPEARLLPGARYLLLHSTSTTQDTLYLYDVWSARRVWYHLMLPCKMCEVDLVPGGAIARVCFVQWAVHPNTHTLHVEEVDLTTGASHELFNFSLGSIVFAATPRAIVGDFLLVSVQHSRFINAKLVLINWRASTFVSLNRNGLYYIQLIPGYILSTYQETSPPHGHILAATALEAFSDRWQMLTDNGAGLAAQLEAGFSSTIMINNLNITTQERLEYSGRPIRFESVAVTPDALHVDAYDISVYGSHFCQSPPPPRSVTLMERIGNLMNITARRGEALPVPIQVLPGARVLLLYRFTPGQGQAGSKFRLMSARVSNALPLEFPRAIPSHSGNSISVVYRQRKGPGADAA
ncbi:hypothetical protein MSAN_01544900 [Mycena sanguinolenta]|uniref:F-box domain-containing protein n=1 Tax=Mycena sanguinolenta TaxID=230812 RepID=A0A8H6Y3N4_9AGAR|nr:hypothetical protein MSAN_01544900 [Mycena sanguinolenta]